MEWVVGRLLASMFYGGFEGFDRDEFKSGGREGRHEPVPVVSSLRLGFDRVQSCEWEAHHMLGCSFCLLCCGVKTELAQGVGDWS